MAEFNAFCVEHIGISYLAKCLQSKFGSKIVSHFSHVVVSYDLKRNLLQKIMFFLGKTFNIGNFGIYNSLGIKDIYFPTPNKKNIIKAKKIHKNFLLKITSREKILKFRIDNIPFGDLFYDSYLKKFYDDEPTIYLNDKKFIDFTYEFILFVVIWLYFFKKNKVKAVMGSHCVYSIGVPLRIALYKNILSFAMNSENLTKLSKKIPLQYCEFINYRKNFNKLKDEQKIKGIKIAKKRLISRLKGEFSPDYHYATRSPFKKLKSNNKRIIKKSKKIKLVVATHDFVDAPHTLGNGFFPDFFQWILFLGKISEKTNYDWYIKTHIPYGGKFDIYQPHERKVVRNFVNRFKKFTQIPPDITSSQIVEEGVDGFLTVNGTIGSEVPYYNIPVINASLNNPHINYKFNIHPKNKNDLKKVIFNFKKIKKRFKIDKKEIFEHYFMKNIYYDKNWLFNNHNIMIKKVGYHDQWTYKIYKYWMKNFNMQIHNDLISRLNRFIESEETRLRRDIN